MRNIDRPQTLFVNKVIRVVAYPLAKVEEEGNKYETVAYQVEDESDRDITHHVKAFSICQNLGGIDWAELELINMPGFDGPFCTPAVDLM